MIHDPIVEEVHRWRQDLLAEFDGDVHALAEHVRQQEQFATAAGRVVVALPPKAAPTPKAKSA